MEDRLSILFRELSRKQRYSLQKYLEAYDLYNGQPHLLFEIQKHPGINQKALLEKTTMVKETLSVSLNRLETSGFIIREVSATDRRSRQLYLTQAGEKVANACRKGFDAIHRSLFIKLSETQKQELEVMFELMIKGLEEGLET